MWDIFYMLTDCMLRNISQSMSMDKFVKIVPKFAKEWVKAHPTIVNFIDRTTHGSRAITVFNEIKGMLGADEREYLFLLAKNLKVGSVVVEIGCFAGLSTYFLGKGAELSRSILYSIDPFAHAVERQLKESDSSWYLDKINQKPPLQSVQVTLKRYRLDHVVTLIESFAQEVAMTWNHGKVDLLWIDGNHLETYDDFKAWEKHLASRAIVAFHDSTGPQGLPEVVRDVERIIAEKKIHTEIRYKTITSIILDN